MNQKEEVGERRLDILVFTMVRSKKILTIKLRSLNWILQKKGSQERF